MIRLQALHKCTFKLLLQASTNLGINISSHLLSLRVCMIIVIILL